MNYNWKISIIIPCFNEENRLESTLQEIKNYFNSSEYEIIIINDWSSDNTESVAKKYTNQIITNKTNMWKGYSIKQWVLNSNSELCLIMDADSSASISQLDKLLNYIGNYDIILWSRFLDTNSIIHKQPLPRRILWLIWHKLLKNLFIKWISDTQCWFKLFHSTAAKSLFKNLFTNRFGYDLEILLKAQKMNLKIKEIAIKWENKKWSKFNSILDWIKTIKEFIVIKYKFIKWVL